jgi:hypothetical protein
MATYRVLYAAIYRKYGLLRVARESYEPDDRGKPLLVVEGEPHRFLKFITGRTVYAEDGSITGNYIFVVEPPDFPITELVGKRLLPGE